MARVEIDEVVFTNTNPVRTVAGASVQVNARGAAPATVYAAETGATTLTNPLVTDSAGRIEGWLTPGSYDLVVTANGTTRTQAYEAASGSVTGTGTGGSGTRLVAAGNLGATYTLDFAGDSDVLVTAKMTANLTLSLANVTAGAVATFELTQDATGGRTLTLPAGTKRPGGTLALTTTANALNVVQVWSPDGTALRAVLVGANFS